MKHVVRHPPAAFSLFRMFYQSRLKLNAALVNGVEERKKKTKMYSVWVYEY
jgi:hypothetical protein